VTGGLFAGKVSKTWRIAEADHVFEDTGPRLWDVTGDGSPEVVVVQSHLQNGARLTVFGLEDGKLWQASTAHIGTRFRWLSPAGAADFDGDGRIEIAFVDRPHLARRLLFWRLEAGALHPVDQLEGVTNHRFGETSILGGVRDCAGRPELVLANADWSGLVAVGFDGASIEARPIGTDTSHEGFAVAMACD
jgi:hypothetical protein